MQDSVYKYITCAAGFPYNEISMIQYPTLCSFQPFSTIVQIQTRDKSLHLSQLNNINLCLVFIHSILMWNSVVVSLPDHFTPAELGNSFPDSLFFFFHARYLPLPYAPSTMLHMLMTTLHSSPRGCLEGQPHTRRSFLISVLTPETSLSTLHGMTLYGIFKISS